MAERSRTLTIFLGKEGASPEALLDKERMPAATPIEVGAIHGTLYTASTKPQPPSWVSFFGDAAASATSKLMTASASALLLVPMKNRVFAVSFGYGRYLLDPLAIESSFGLRATLNSVPSDKIRSIDKRTFEGITTHTREQASKETTFADFGLDVERDVLRAVVGTPSDATLGNRLSGMDALTATCHATLDELPELLQAYLAKSLDSTYKKRFPWIDNILEVRDKMKRQKLDALVVEAVKSGATAQLWLAVPDLIEWTDIEGFSYSAAKSAPRYPDLHIKDLLNEVTAQGISAESLRSRKVFAWRSSTDHIFDKWPVYRCIYAEVSSDDDTYLLSNGEWYQLDDDFVELVDAAVEGISESSMNVPDYGVSENEDDYNLRLAQWISGSCCMDRKLIYYGGGKSSVEFCDVYSPARQMIHVKRYSGSTVLSHLFAQGTVSATSFISDERFRQEVNKLLPSALRVKNPAKKPSATDYEVAFLIASRSVTPLTLPFFSRVTLRNTHTLLTSYGFKVTVTKVPVA
jgi:uncharacterized protein (TIGR04141 family)